MQTRCGCIFIRQRICTWLLLVRMVGGTGVVKMVGESRVPDRLYRLAFGHPQVFNLAGSNLPLVNCYLGDLLLKAQYSHSPLPQFGHYVSSRVATVS